MTNKTKLFKALTIVNKAKTFFSAVLLSQVVLNTVAPVLASPYNYEQYDQRYNSASPSTTTVKSSTSTSEIAVLSILGGLMLLSIFGNGDSGPSSYDQQTQDTYYYRNNTSNPSYSSSPSSVKPISPFYGSCHSYDC